jgi:hypothetical protein
MKYFNKKSFAIEQIFASYLYDESGNKVIDTFYSKKGDKQYKINIEKDSFEDIFELLSDIASDKYDMLDFIPNNILRIITESNRDYGSKEIAIILKWIKQCIDTNNKDYSRWRLCIDDVMMQLKWNKINCFNKLSCDIFPTRINITKLDNNNICITPNPLLWGAFNFQFSDVTFIDLEYNYIECYLLWLEIYKRENQYEFKFLVNLDMKHKFTIEKLILADNWLEFKIICKLPELHINYYDYAFKWVETGCQSTKIFLEGCKALICKERDLGTLYVNEKERKLLHLAHLYFCLSPALNGGSSDNTPLDTNRLDSLISNRFGFEQACNYIKDAGDINFFNALDELKKALEDREITECSYECNKIWRILVNRDKSELGRKLYYNLSKNLLEATSSYEKAWRGRDDFICISASIINIIEPRILEMDFEGQFPHYRRVVRNKGEYISFVIENHLIKEATSTYNADRIFNVSIVVGRVHGLKKIKGVYSLSDIIFKDTNSWECSWEKFRCRLTSIGPSEDYGRFTVNVNTDKSKQYFSVIDDQINAMLPYTEVIKSIFQNRKLPEFYIKHHKEFLKKRKTTKVLTSIMLLSGLAFGFILWFILKIVFPMVENGQLPEKAFKVDEFLQFMGFSFFWSMVIGALVLFNIRRKVWIL